jgi:flagellar basal body-associated protein FliL
MYDKKDLEGSGDTKLMTNEETGEKELVKVLDEKDVTNLTTEDGEQFPFKNSDLGENKGGMSKGLKIGLIVGGAVLVLGIVGYLIYRSRKNGQGK